MTDLTTKPNAELAYAVLDHIDTHPGSWNQAAWLSPHACGTAACFAGWACLLSGEEPKWQNGTKFSTSMLASGSAVSDRAQELLAASRYLTDHNNDTDDERDLFHEWNDREDLGRMVAEIFGPRPTTGGA